VGRSCLRQLWQAQRGGARQGLQPRAVRGATPRVIVWVGPGEHASLVDWWQGRGTKEIATATPHQSTGRQAPHVQLSLPQRPLLQAILPDVRTARPLAWQARAPAECKARGETAATGALRTWVAETRAGLARRAAGARAQPHQRPRRAAIRRTPRTRALKGRLRLRLRVRLLLRLLVCAGVCCVAWRRGSLRIRVRYGALGARDCQGEPRSKHQR
jgi:hypothetical protein